MYVLFFLQFSSGIAKADTTTSTTTATPTVAKRKKTFWDPDSDTEYDKLKKFVDNYTQKMAFLDAFYLICLLSENGSVFLETEEFLLDELVCAVLTDKHLEKCKKAMKEGKRKSVLENILESF